MDNLRPALMTVAAFLSTVAIVAASAALSAALGCWLLRILGFDQPLTPSEEGAEDEQTSQSS